MADAINTGNPVSTTKFIVNKYDDIDGGRVNQETPRGRLGFKDTNGRYTLPRDPQEATKSVYALDWPKPLNPPPYYEGPGLNGALPYGFSDGSLGTQENTFAMDPDTVYQTPWPIGYKVFDVPPYFYDLPVTSGNFALVFDEGTFTYGSGNYVGSIASYAYGDKLYTSYSSGNQGKLTNVAPSGVTAVVGVVFDRDVYGPGTLTVKLKGTDAL
jgi:hypothetical protein